MFLKGMIHMKEVISSEQNERVKSLKKLYNKKKRRQKGKFVLEGFRIIDEALKADAVFDYMFMSPDFYKSTEGQSLIKAYLKDDNNNKGNSDNKNHHNYNEDSDNANRNDNKEENLIIIEEKLLSKIADTNSPQGVIAVVNEPEYDISDIFCQENENGKLLLLDRIQDPGNMGTIIRTAVAAGIDGIIILKGSVDIYNLKVLRATMGAIFNIPLLKDVTMEEFLELYNGVSEKCQLIAADLSADLYYHQLEYDFPFIIAIGNEANGLNDKIVNSANYLVKIPIIGDIDSLNAAIATGILVYKALEMNCD